MTKKLFINSFIYILGDVLNKSIPFFMLPILTRYLTPEDYGLISIFGVLVSIFTVFVGLSIHGSINVNFFKIKKKELKVFIANCLIILNISTLFIVMIVYLLYPILLERLTLEIEWIILAIILAFSQFLTTINLLLWTAEQNPKCYSLYQISQTVLVVLITIILIIGFSMNWKGQIIATAVGTIMFSVVSIVFIYKRGYFTFKYNKEYLKEAIQFGVPLIPHALSGVMKTGADKLILVSLLGTTVTGIYSVGYQIGMVLGIICTAFNKAWAPFLFKTLANNPSFRDKLKIVRFSYIYFIGIFLLSIFFSLISEYLIPYFLGNRFLEVNKIIIYISLAFAFDGMYYIVTNYLFFMKKTYLLSYVTFGTSILHLLLLYYLININSMIGAAQASTISFFITFLLVWYISNKVYPMPWFKSTIFMKEKNDKE